MILALKKAFISDSVEAVEGRKSIRYSIVEPCRVERWGKSYDAMTRNISKGGISLDIAGMGSSALDADLTIYFRDFEPLVAESRWSHKRTFGLKFINDSDKSLQLLDLIASLESSTNS